MIVRHVDVVVPVVFYKVDRIATSVVLVTMLVPFFCVTGRHSQVNRLRGLGNSLDDDRLRIDHLWRRDIANIDAAVKARLSDLHGYSYVGGLSWSNRRRGE